MGSGKIAAQCCHAALGVYRQIINNPSYRSALLFWESHGEKTVCLKVKDYETMRELEKKAQSLQLPTQTIMDAGRTEVEPGSITVLAIGPGATSVINQVTGQLKLL